jgi:nitrogen fixation-related uncharacterized protein
VIDATWKLVAIEAFLLIVLMLLWSGGRGQ